MLKPFNIIFQIFETLVHSIDPLFGISEHFRFAQIVNFQFLLKDGIFAIKGKLQVVEPHPQILQLYAQFGTLPIKIEGVELRLELYLIPSIIDAMINRNQLLLAFTEKLVQLQRAKSRLQIRKGRIGAPNEFALTEICNFDPSLIHIDECSTMSPVIAKLPFVVLIVFRLIAYSVSFSRIPVPEVRIPSLELFQIP